MPLMTFMSKILNQSTIESTTTHPSLLRGSNQQNSDPQQGNLVWFEDDFGVGGIGSPRLIGHNSYRRYVQLSPLLPFGMMLIISTIIFILIIFRGWPGLVAGIVAGCLTSISIYLILLTLKEQRLVYELPANLYAGVFV